ncbi:MAG: hypothetical protein KTR31_15205 [Myxococcales bacterium]|nr:hypothetical protein [Myxococcales bacterium]
MKTRHLVALDADHPGFRDRAYRARRDAIAQAALQHREGQPVEEVAYTDEEQAVWQEVGRCLGPLHTAGAHPEILALMERLDLFGGAVPQFEPLNQRLGATGFRMEPVAGLVSPRDFLQALGRDTFMATQYMRHPSRPLYTPEPDVVHEIVGHAASLLHEGVASVSRCFGRAAAGASDDEIVGLVRVYWWTLEFGLVREEGQVYALGAGLLSSAGELAQIASGPQWKPFDIDVMAATDFDPTQQNPVLFVADGLQPMLEALTVWLEAIVQQPAS